MSREFDVVIAGAGPVGCATAALIIARGIAAPGRVAVLAGRDRPAATAVPAGSAASPAIVGGAAAGSPAGAARAPDWTAWDLRVFALSRASQWVLEVCGAWKLLPAELVFPYERMCVWDESGTPQGEGSLTFDCAELGEPNLGVIVDGRALNDGCARAAAAAGAVSIESGCGRLEPSARGLGIELRDGRTLDTRLLVAADGAASKTRELLGIAVAGHAYHQDALVAHVRTEHPHRRTAWQRFLSEGPLAFLPLSDGRSSIVWSVGRAHAERLRALDAGAFSAAVEAASGGVLGEVQITTPVAGYPIQLQYALDYARPHAVLLGDAAHAVHPLAGQGLNLGFLDCASLIEALDRAGAGSLGDHGPLRRYERRRKSENLLAATAFDGLERLFSSPNPGIARLRAAGLGAVGALPWVKRGIARRALGIGGDVPSFLGARGR